jgi:uncharacterized repeat protein (TIGR01451 family)
MGRLMKMNDDKKQGGNEMKNIVLSGLLMLVAILMLAGNGSAATATNLMLDYTSTGVDANLKPGDSGILTVVVRNTGSFSAENVQLTIPDETDVHAAKLFYIGNIDAGSSKTVSTTVHVDDTARVGLHTLQARFSYDGFKSDGTKDDQKQVSWDIPVRIYGKANFQFSVANANYIEDVEGSMTVEVNSKVEAREVTAKLTSSCASIIGSDKQYLGDMAAGGGYPITYYLKPTQTGTCPLTLLLDYSDASGVETFENTSIGINVERSSIDLKVVDIADGTLALGTVSDITLRIKNVGNNPASDVSVLMDLQAPFMPVKSAQKYVGAIKQGETQNATFTISVDSSAKKKSYSIPVTIEYYDQAGIKQDIPTVIGLSVGGSADIKVNLDKKDPLIAGSTGKVTIGVVNSGFVDAKFLTIRLQSTADYQVTSADSAYIGALNSDDSDSQDFEIKVYSNVTNVQIPLKVRVEYKEENNDQLLVNDETIDVSLLSKEEYNKETTSGGILPLVLGVIGVVVALIAVYLGIWVIARVLGIVTNTLDKKVFKRNHEE